MTAVDKIKKISLQDLIYLVPFLALGAVFGLSELTDLGLPTWLSLLNVLGVLLIYLTILQVNQRQAEIQGKQQQIYEFEQKSLLRVDDYVYLPADAIEAFSDILNISLDDWERHAGKCMLRISNFGSGPAKGLRLAVVIEAERELPSGDTHYLKQATSQPLFHGNHWDPVVTTKQQEGGVIGKDERQIDFIVNPSFPVQGITEDLDLGNLDQNFLSPTEVLWEMADKGFDEVTIGVKLFFRDASGPREPINVRFAKGSIHEHQNFGYLLINGDTLASEDAIDIPQWNGGGVYDS